MIIQGSHLNHGFMQKLQSLKAQGKSLGADEMLLQESPGARLGQGMKVYQTKANLTSDKEPLASVQQGRLPEKAPETIGQAVANEIVRRMDVAQTDDGQTKDVTDLRHSIGSTMDWIRERYGDETATAAAGMLLSSTSGTVNETSIGDGLLNTLKFIDRNHGIAAGDAAIAQFNTGVNAELNEYFDNGQSEVFYVAESLPDTDQPSATQDISARFFARAIQNVSTEDANAESLSEQLLDSLKSELDNIAELQDLTSQLEADFSPTKATQEAAMAAYAGTSVFTEPQFRDLTV